MPPNLDWVTNLPPFLQFALFLGFGLGMILVAQRGYLAGKKDVPPAPKDVVLTAAGITDMGPIRENAQATLRLAMAQEKALEETGRIADELGTIRQILAEDSEERREYRQWRKGFEAGQGQREKPAPRRR